MRTYDDTFSGQRIYPGKVRFQFSQADFAVDAATAMPRTQPLITAVATLHQALKEIKINALVS